MPSRLPLAAAVLVAAPLATLATTTAQAAPAPAVSGSVTALTITVTGIPNEQPGGSGTQSCTIAADLYKPAGADATHRVPAILTTNGFGGSKLDQAELGKLASSNGYAVLSYSGLGFGGSSCKISLDDPSYDGVAGSQLVSFLGGDPSITAKDSGGNDVHVDFVRLDTTAHDGKHHDYDPRVGMIGGSYGGQIQFAVASVDPRLDTIIPIITWNDLAYSLAPNNTAFTRGVTYAPDAPGTEKFDWVSLFFGVGIVDGLQGAQIDPARNVGCPNFLTEACVAKAELDAGGVATPDVIDFARHASVTSYMSRIRIPTLLAQGEADTLFNLNEAAATYRALKAQGTPVKMIWQSWGHSNSTAAKGEYSSGSGALDTYEGQRFFAWFDHYLKGTNADTGPGFAYFRPWVPFSGSGPDTVQYGTAPSYPVGSQQTLYFSGSGDLVAQRSALKPSSQSYTNVGGSVPTSYSETSAVQGSLPSQATQPKDAPGTFTSWSTPALARAVDVAGIPTATVHVQAPTTTGATPAAQLLFFAKIYDVAPDGSIDLVNRLISPVRVPDASKPVTVTLPGIVHRFEAGHRIEFVMAATDAAYRNAYPVQPVTVTSSASAPSTLTLPVVSAGELSHAVKTRVVHVGPKGPRPGTVSPRGLPATGLGAALPLTGAGLVVLAAAGAMLQRRARLAGRS